MDEIVVNYVLGFVEDSVAGDPVDIEGVKQLVEAYEPSFSDVPDHEIEEWIIKTGQTLKQRRDKGSRIVFNFKKIYMLSLSSDLDCILYLYLLCL